ncbi:Transmembrane protein [Ceratobasidium theobromae]|uniref:Transmembrane protein n=1 Tax=Ceratobasidium theobromae TaxID=1582974 RepID=A0A5N5QFS2_9AGAM|nr:Transmembrane protein [Ceratobasidium theobromae]
MLAFSRLTSILFFVLSLGLLTYALPAESKALAARHASDNLTSLIVDLGVKVNAHVDVMVREANVNTVVELTTRVDALVADVNACAKAILAQPLFESGLICILI